MDRRERLRRCYYHEEMDRPGVYVRTNFPNNDPSYERLKAYLAAHAELKRWWSSAEIEHTPDITSTTRTESLPNGRLRRIVTLHTLAGEFERREQLVDPLRDEAQEESYFLKTREDAERYLSLPLPTFAGDPSSAFRQAVAEMGDRGIVDVSIGANPGGSVVPLFGSETFAILSVTDRDIIHALLERFLKIALTRVKLLLGCGVGPYFSMLGEEYIVPPLAGPKDFYDFNVKYDKSLIDLVHGAGGRMHVHSHGSIKKVFQGFIDMGVDVLHPFEAPPMGDITAKEAKALARGRICLEGNIQIHRFYETSPAEIRGETEVLIADCFDDHRGLIVCPTASPYIFGAGEQAFPQFKAMVDTVLAYH